MTNTNTNGGGRFAEDVIEEAASTIDRLRDLQPGEHTVEIPDAMTRWRRSAEASAFAHEKAEQERQQRDAEIAGAVELQQAEVEAEADAGWEAWIVARLAAERVVVLDILAEVVGKAVVEMRDEFETKVATLTRELDEERAARQHDRDRAHERLKGQRAAHAEKIAVLETRIAAQQRALDLLEIRSRESEVEHERRTEREENAAAMVRMVYEEFMLRR
jgi:hypothetical protein